MSNKLEELIYRLEQVKYNWEEDEECQCCGNNTAHFEDLIKALEEYKDEQ